MTWHDLRGAQSEALNSMRRNRLLVLLSVFSLAVCLLCLALSAAVFKSVRSSFPPWYSESRVNLVLQMQISDEEQEALASELRKWPEVQSVVSISREAALQRMRKALGESSGILDGFRESPLPPCIEVQFKAKENSSSRLESHLGKLRGLPQVSEVLSGKGWGERLEPIYSSLMLTGYVLIPLLALILVFVAFLHTSSSIARRLEELEILTLLGADRTHVQLPFYLEVTYMAVFASLLAMGVLAYLLWELKKALPAIAHLELASNTTLTLLFIVVPSASGIILNWLGCWLSFKHFRQALK